ncbi:ACR3 family arsenite efflux transporter [Cryobacterium sp. CG_9.6]|uniref:ACR3 family arsenite efflux transporter n=1 Tax=Cryobacterium sp. CG_9.6 TaxID=2760710 RepID=UPI0024771BB1|nr:ACR3 family arsenite efflux transporter [Cryobacterium sp. CG_9.6]MDH6236850.1 ACR3 family arsenite transporter [Cryobacterium sp. CG_9.6]
MISPAPFPAATRSSPVSAPRLGLTDRYLPVWILAAMGVGLLLAAYVPAVGNALHAFSIGTVSIPIALGLLVMMYPVLAKVRYSDARAVAGDRRLLVSSLLLNWILGPALMFVLAWIFLPDLPEYRTGLIIVGLARCIAMVLIWNDLACGDREAAAFLVAVNSVFQVIAFGALGWFYLQILPGWLGLPTTSADFSFWAITVSVLVFLGIPLVAGYLSRRIGEARRGRDWYEAKFLPRVGPFALYGLLFTIVLLFALQGEQVLAAPLDVLRIALPMLVYFAVMFLLGFGVGKLAGLPYERTTTLAFTATGNNFELAIAVAIGTFGATSGQALAGIVGPLIEVPALIALVYVALWLRPRLFPAQPVAAPEPTRIPS